MPPHANNKPLTIAQALAIAWCRLAFYGALAPITIVCAFAIAVCTLAPVSWRLTIIRFWAWSFLYLARVIYGIRWQWHGLHHIPDTAAVLMANHESAWETIALWAIFHRITAVFKREIFYIPVFGWALALMPVIAINRSQPIKALKQIIGDGKQRLQQQNLHVLIFPEGTRVAVGERRPFLPGAVKLAKKAQSLIVPIAHNAGDHWPGRGKPRRPGVIHVHIGQPWSCDDGQSEATLTAEIQAWIEAQKSQLRTNLHVSRAPTTR